MVIFKKKLRLFLLLNILNFPFYPLARTVNIYVENKTHDPIFAVDHSQLLKRIDSGKVKLVSSQERKPAQYHDSHYIPDALSVPTDLFLLQLKDPLVLTITTSSAPLHGIGKNFVKRDRLEWIVSYPSLNPFQEPSFMTSLSRYQSDKSPTSNSAYIIRGQKKGSDFHGLPAADLYFTIEETPS